MIFLFWVSLLFLVYTYLGYPLTLWILARCCPRPVQKKTPLHFPSVSVVIAARDEEANVRNRLQDIVDQDYPGHLDIIFISDNSTDSTVSRAQELAEELKTGKIAVHVLAQSAVSGKPSAVNRGVTAATGELVVFADARQRFSSGAITALAANFSDPQVGCVSGELVFVDNNQGGLQVEMGAYWKYEKAIRKMEAATGSVMGATGAIYAIRRKLYIPLPKETLLDDVLTPVNILSQGYRVVFDSSAIARDSVSPDISGEWRRKVRTLAGNWQLLGNGSVCGKAFRHHFFFRFFWHKAARLCVPFILPLFLFTSLFAGTAFSLLCFVIQLLLYCLALLFWKLPSFGRSPVAKLCYFFCLLNWAVVVGCWIWFTGRSDEIWKRK